MTKCKNQSIDNEMVFQLLKNLDSYLNMNNDDLANTIIHWDLLGNNNLRNENIIYSYISWSYTVSFLYMINAWQWFLSGVLLSRQANLPAQILQLWYYSIFFSSLSFLASQFKGYYTVSIKIPGKNDKKIDTRTIKEIIEEIREKKYTKNTEEDFLKYTKTRRAVWLEVEHDKFKLALEPKQNKGGQHEAIAYWFYEVFNTWRQKDMYPGVASFIKERNYHTYFRNLYTYSLADISEELFGGKNTLYLPNNIIFELWNKNTDIVDCFPEAFWAIEHLKLVTDLHTQFITSNNNALKLSQKILLEGLYKLHKETGLDEVIDIIFKDILDEIKPRITKYNIL